MGAQGRKEGEPLPRPTKALNTLTLPGFPRTRIDSFRTDEALIEGLVGWA